MFTFSPFNFEVEEYSDYIARREYWDSFAREWRNSPMEAKLIRLGGFVLKGGNLNDVLERYAEGRDFTYRHQVQSCVLTYIINLMSGETLDIYTKSPTLDRLKRLDKEELVLLLTRELKRRVRQTYAFIKGDVEKHWEVSKEDLLNDDILSEIEEEHWRNHPEESFAWYLKRTSRWDDPNFCLW